MTRAGPSELSIKANRTAAAIRGFLICLVLISGAAAALIYTGKIPWPFHGAATPVDTYGRALVYLPFLFFALFSIFWLRAAGVPFLNYLRWGRFSVSFAAGLLLSAGYAAWLLYSHSYPLKGPAFLPPVSLLILMNSLSEEILFRLVLFLLLYARYGSFAKANIIQAGVYAIPHLAIGGPVFFLFAAVYGLVLGWIVNTGNSILPAVICHVIIDIGAVGLPMMIVL